MRCDDCNSTVDGDRVLCAGCAEAFSEALRAENERLAEALRDVSALLEPINTVKVACGGAATDAAERIGQARVRLDAALARLGAGKEGERG